MSDEKEAGSAHERIDAILLVALSIDELRKQGTPEHAEALAIKDSAIKLWKEQLWSKRKCPHCGREL